jgi:hypothetical protein
VHVLALALRGHLWLAHRLMAPLCETARLRLLRRSRASEIEKGGRNPALFVCPGAIERQLLQTWMALSHL